MVSLSLLKIVVGISIIYVWTRVLIQTDLGLLETWASCLPTLIVAIVGPFLILWAFVAWWLAALFYGGIAVSAYHFLIVVFKAETPPRDNYLFIGSDGKEIPNAQ